MFMLAYIVSKSNISTGFVGMMQGWM